MITKINGPFVICVTETAYRWDYTESRSSSQLNDQPVVHNCGQGLLVQDPGWLLPLEGSCSSRKLFA